MLRKGSLTGLLLFGIFFGAGNLIFPPALGALSGNQFWPAIAGFVLSGVGIAIVTLIIRTLNPKGYIHEISRKDFTCFRDCILSCALSFDWSFLCHSKDSDGIFRSGDSTPIRWNECQFSTFHFYPGLLFASLSDCLESI